MANRADRVTQHQVDFWSRPLSDLLAALGCSLDGLDPGEAAARLTRFGRNVLQAGQRITMLGRMLRRLRNPLVLILLGAAGVAAATGEVSSFVIVALIVALSVLIDSIQERSAETAAEKLKASVALVERVRRGGQEMTVSAEDIVPGDIVLLAAGDLVPADGRIVEANDFFVNEAALTGEPYPREKRPSDTLPESDLAEAGNAAFMGSSVISGSAKLLVVVTAGRTELGRIASTLRREPPPTALERGTYQFGILIMRLTVLLALFALLVNIVYHRPVLESFLFAIALAVGLTPELLPMVVSVTLARGALRLANERVIVKRLAAVHDLGAMDILCSDKTGTLTEARIKLVREISLTGKNSQHVLDLAWLNSHFETGLRSPLDDAILEKVPAVPDGWTKVDEVPFGFDRRRVSVLLERQGERRLIVKGAPEDMLRLCDRYEPDDPGPPLPLDAAALAQARQVFERMSADGFRLLGIAWRILEPGQSHASVEDETSLVFAGFAAFLDPPKPSAGDAVCALQNLGVRVKVVTGDNEFVTRRVCQDLGIAATEVLTGAEISTLDDDALAARAEDTVLFCRVTPAQKNRILLALKRRGHTVGFLGDGINDASALHTADVGVSVDSAVDVAKDAANLILLEKDLRVLERGVREGRRTFANIMKYIMMGTSSNFGNMFSMAGATLVLPFLPMLPIQILLNNLLYDVSEITIPLDKVDPEAVAQPRRWDMAFIRDFMMTLGPVSSLFDFLTFGLLIWGFHAGEALFQTGWFVESLATQVLVIFVLRTRGSPLTERPRPLLAASSVLVLTVAVALPFTPVGAWFGFVPLPAIYLAALAMLTLTYLLLAEATKRWFFKRRLPRFDPHQSSVATLH
jgi:Mg2+-importing ATPase